ncbi:hypothetical protein [Butyrivibrio sp. AE2032]|uniref:hypothetical protein n=1 Tax=Butyrivibrio sp. AE2032 TaxID=1458463 RepID=UPI00054F97B8|nr:hypothetical protein [Butyrivibrio sp. AE2032]
MTLGDIIKEYLEEHTVNEFIRDSGISKAYTYNLINNKGTNGAAPTPTIETINKVAKGVHSDFDTVFSKLDPDIVLSTSNAAHRTTEDTRKHVSTLYQFTVKNEDGTIRIVLRPPYNKYLPLLSDKNMRLLLAAAKDCNENQIQLAINMLNTFKNKE